MHDRGDYKSGWQIDRDYAEQQKKDRMKMQGEDGITKSVLFKRILLSYITNFPFFRLPVPDEVNYEVNTEDELPFVCLICRKEFVLPVVTKCDHYFCEKCALRRYVKDTKCFVCKGNGLLNFNHHLMFRN